MLSLNQFLVIALLLGMSVNSSHGYHLNANLKRALLFDCDGVLAETERDGHRVAFNQAFKEYGIDCEWDAKLYGKLLRIGGGKERMTSYFNKIGWPENVAEFQRKVLIEKVHKTKTAHFQNVVNSKSITARPGGKETNSCMKLLTRYYLSLFWCVVIRLIDDALQQQICVGICSTSNQASVESIVRVLLGLQRVSSIQIFAGDLVEHKKPAPDIYQLAAKKFNVEPSNCWVVEDSSIGLAAAKGAGMKCLVTKSIYTQEEDFSLADEVVTDLDHGKNCLISTAYLWRNVIVNEAHQ